ncbi:hypothetical protein RBI22_00310 [Alcaligenaceae bacterium C4P045]|nr:hypothetical protein [Alcaligenaceae bacterium C4P045]
MPDKTPKVIPPTQNPADTRPAAGRDDPTMKGSGALPMPSDAPKVAGMQRASRVHTEPGDPGVPAPESQITGGAPPDTLQEGSDDAAKR